MPKALTAKSVEQARGLSGKRQEIADGLLAGLYLVVQPSGAKSWAVRYRHAGTPRKLTLGAYPALDLAKARDGAREALRSAAKGEDPAAAKKARRATAALGADRDMARNVIAEFLRRHASRNRSAAETERLFNREVLPAWGDKRIQEISKRDVIELLDKIADSGRGTTANRTLAAVRKLFNWCLERDILAASPCAGVKPPAAERNRDRILSDDEIRWLWEACDALDYPFGPLVKLLLVTAQREEEVGQASYGELALSADPPSWTIPAARAKNGREQFVPLSRLAVEIISALKRISSKAGYLFTTTGATPVSGFSRAKEKLDREMLRIACAETGDAELQILHWTYHDIRRTAASGMARLGQQVHVVEAVLNHKSGTIRGVAAVYNRYSYADEKRRALEAWGSFLEQLVSGEPAGNVQRLPRGPRVSADA